MGKGKGRSARGRGEETRSREVYEDYGANSPIVTTADDCEGEEEDDEGEEIFSPHDFPVSLYMWEFGQNDPKRDSGSKLRRLGYSKQLKIGQTFKGVVLSSEAQDYVSLADRPIVEAFGIAGINCSWNRLSEIPFDSMGKGRNQRLLPLLFAANSVNYGRPHKLNTAEAMAATLFLTGYPVEARLLLSPFGYGEEFFRLNDEALQAYSRCQNSSEVQRLQEGYIRNDEIHRQEKEERKQRVREGCTMGEYLDDMDLPPSDDDEGYGYGSEEEEELGDVEKACES